MFDVLIIHSPAFISIQKGGEDQGPEDHDFGFYIEAMIAEDPI